MKHPRGKPSRALPGFGLTLGFTLFYSGLLVLLPLAGLFYAAGRMSWSEFAHKALLDPRVLAAYRLSFGAAAAAAAVNTVFGSILAWVLTRYSFPGKRLVDASVDLPFVVRTVHPALEELDAEFEEAAASLVASRGQTFRRVILPAVLPSVLSGFTLAFARAVGEFGSVFFIAGNMPLRTEIAPLLIVIKLEQYDYAGAAAIGVVMLVLSFLLLLAINSLQAWSGRRRQ